MQVHTTGKIRRARRASDHFGFCVEHEQLTDFADCGILQTRLADVWASDRALLSSAPWEAFGQSDWGQRVRAEPGVAEPDVTAPVPKLRTPRRACAPGTPVWSLAK